VFHFVELQELLDEKEGVLPLAAFCEFLDFEVFGVEWGGLCGGGGTFLEDPSWESMVLKTEERICARMLLRYPFFSRFCITRFLSSFSSSI
jgi:hypothetical protein